MATNPDPSDKETRPMNPAGEFTMLAGRYRLDKRLGAGGFGEVYLAHDEQLLAKLVVVKILKNPENDPWFVKKFQQEKEALARIRHHGVVEILGDGMTPEQTPFLVMQYVEGVPLREAIRAGGLSLSQIAGLIRQIGLALTAVHQNGVCHRDLKPENIMLQSLHGEQHIVLIDFGISGITDSRFGGGATKIAGSLAYMAPEQMAGQASAASDIYSFGLIAFELLAGRLPVNHSAQDVAVALRESRPDAPDAAATAIAKALSLDPQQRFRSAREFSEVLFGALQTAAVSPPVERQLPPTQPVTSPPRPRTVRWPFAAGAVLVLTLLAGLVIIFNVGGLRSRFGKQLETSPGTSQAGASSRTRPVIAVLGFKNTSGQAEDAWISTALSEFLSTELSAGEKLRLVAGENIVRMKTDFGLPNTSGYSRDTLDKIWKVLGSDYVISGSYLRMPSTGALRMDLRLQDARNGEPVASDEEEGGEADLSALVKRAANRVRRELGVAAPSPAEITQADAALPGSSEAAELYAKGLERLRAYDLLGARDLLERSVASDPNAPLAHAALAEAWGKLGFDDKAIQESRKAKDLSANFSLESRMQTEGAYYRTTSAWDQAIGVYRELWNHYPDEIDYALDLAACQTDAGRAADGLATLAQLRKQSAKARQDPRVDLQEALAAEKLSDLKRQAAAAVAAARKATAQGSKLLAATAYWQECGALQGIGDLGKAQAACMQANELADATGARQIRARGLTVLATIYQTQGRTSEAMELRQEALHIQEQIGSRKDIIGALMQLADLQSSQNQLREASEGYKKATAMALEIGDKQQLPQLQDSQASILFQQGDYSGAQGMYGAALKTATETGDKQEMANAAMNLGIVLFQLGRLLDSRRYSQQALDIAQEAGFKSKQALSLGALGDILSAQDDLAGARGDYDNALKIFMTLGDQANVAATRVSLARLLLESGSKPQESEKLARQAIDEFQREKNIDQEADARQTLARALEAQGNLQGAIGEVEAARKLSPQDRGIQMAVATVSARLQARAGKITEAKKALESTLAQANQLGLIESQLEIRLALADISAASAGARAAVERDARQRGYLLIAAKAGRPPR